MLVELFHMRQAETIDKWLSHRHLVVKACQGVGSSPSVYWWMVLVGLFHMRQAGTVNKWLSHWHLVVKACQGARSSPSVYDNILLDGVGRVVPYAPGWDC